jgi:hypothetical protein
VLTAGRVVPGVADRRQRRYETVEGMDFAGARATRRARAHTSAEAAG